LQAGGLLVAVVIRMKNTILIKARVN
jgi:hypothetical protein